MSRDSTPSTWTGGGRPDAASLATSLLARAVALALAWWALVEGDPSVLGYGLVVVPLVVVLSLALSGPPAARRPHPGRRLLAAVGLAGWILGRALVGGADVARRALAPRLDVDPFWTTYRTTLPEGSARVGLVLVMNLLPGSLSASLSGDRIDVHVISPDLDVTGTLEALERRLARLVDG